MSEVNENAGEGQVAAPAKKTVKKAVKAKKPAPKASAKKAAKGKPAKAKKESGPRATNNELFNKMLKAISKAKNPMTRQDLAKATGVNSGLSRTGRKLVEAGFAKRDAAKFHDLGRGYCLSCTAKGKAAAAKL